jgi:hypothetical protein
MLCEAGQSKKKKRLIPLIRSTYSRQKSQKENRMVATETERRKRKLFNTQFRFCQMKNEVWRWVVMAVQQYKYT